jgi:integrase
MFRQLIDPHAIRRYPEQGRERYLSQEELTRLIRVLEGDASQAADVVRLLLLTGARPQEVMSMRWHYIDWERREWVKPATSRKQKRIHRSPLTAPTLSVPESISRHPGALRQKGSQRLSWVRTASLERL